jgi:hypothetical protein
MALKFLVFPRQCGERKPKVSQFSLQRSKICCEKLLVKDNNGMHLDNKSSGKVSNKYHKKNVEMKKFLCRGSKKEKSLSKKMYLISLPVCPPSHSLPHKNFFPK